MDNIIPSGFTVLQYSQESTCVGVSFIKKRLKQRLKDLRTPMFKGTYFEEQLRMAAPVSRPRVPP